MAQLPARKEFSRRAAEPQRAQPAEHFSLRTLRLYRKILQLEPGAGGDRQGIRPLGPAAPIFLRGGTALAGEGPAGGTCGRDLREPSRTLSEPRRRRVESSTVDVAGEDISLSISGCCLVGRAVARGIVGGRPAGGSPWPSGVEAAAGRPAGGGRWMPLTLEGRVLLLRTRRGWRGPVPGRLERGGSSGHRLTRSGKGTLRRSSVE